MCFFYCLLIVIHVTVIELQRKLLYSIDVNNSGGEIYEAFNR